MGKKTTSIVVVDYDPSWPTTFEQVRVQVWPAVQDVAIGIEHVGSTSVPGLAAKPIIDMDVVVPSERGHGRVRPGSARIPQEGDEAHPFQAGVGRQPAQLDECRIDAQQFDGSGAPARLLPRHEDQERNPCGPVTEVSCTS